MNKFLNSFAIFLIISYTGCLAFDDVHTDFLYKSSASLNCISTGWDDDDMVFYRIPPNGEREKLVENNKVKIEDGIANISDLRRSDIEADYICAKEGSDEELKFTKNVLPFLRSPEKQSQTVTEDGKVEFKCNLLYGSDDSVTWEWIRNGSALIDDEFLDIKSDLLSSNLTIMKVKLTDKGEIYCKATNTFGSHSSKFNLRVKHTLAALWPFLAIVAEVLILCVIILIYEKKCNKKPQNVGEDNEQAENLMGKEGQGDLKKRNPKV